MVTGGMTEYTNKIILNLSLAFEKKLITSRTNFELIA